MHQYATWNVIAIDLYINQQAFINLIFKHSQMLPAARTAESSRLRPPGACVTSPGHALRTYKNRYSIRTKNTKKKNSKKNYSQSTRLMCAEFARQTKHHVVSDLLLTIATPHRLRLNRLGKLTRN